MAKKNKTGKLKDTSSEIPSSEQSEEMNLTAEIDTREKNEIHNYWKFFPISERTGILPLIILIIVSIGTYVNTIPNKYCLDDTIVLQVNTHVKEGFGGIKKILLREPFKNDFGNEMLRKRYYRQLSVVTYAIEHAFFGDGENAPHISHALNIIFYALTVAILYLLLKDFFFKTKPEIAFITAFIFAIHPLHTEVVANIKSRDEIFCMLFCIGSLYLAFKYFSNQNKNILILLSSMGCYFLGLLSKENAIVFLGMYPLSYYFFLDKEKRWNFTKLLKDTSPYVGVLFIYFLFRSSAIGIDTAVEHTDKLHNRFMDETLMTALSTKILYMGYYLKMLIFPDVLVWDYSYNALPFKSFSDPWVIISLIINAGLLGYGLWGLKTKNPISYGILVYYGLIFIVSNFIINIGGYVAERFLFQPSIGFSLVVGILTYELLNKLTNALLKRAIMGFFLVSILLLGGYKVISRNTEWKDNDTLFIADVKKNPNSALLNKAAGGVFLARSVREKDPKLQQTNRDHALHYFEIAYKIYPQYADALINLGSIHFTNKNYDKAAKYWSELKNNWPTHPRLRECHDYILNEYLKVANDAFSNKENKDYPTYIEYSRKAMPFAVDGDEKIPLNIGLAYRDLKQWDSSSVYLTKACSIQPNNADYWIILALVNGNINRFDLSKFNLEQALRVDPNNAAAKELLSQTMKKLEEKSSTPK